MWVSLALFIISYTVSAILLYARMRYAKPPPQNELDPFFAPRNTEGDPVPILYGRRSITSPNITWFGGGGKRFTPGKSNEDTHLGFDLALCMGPGVTLTEIKVGAHILREGGGIGPDRTLFYVDEPSIRGTNNGMRGMIAFYGGELDQPIDNFLEARRVVLGDPALEFPSYTGVAHIVFREDSEVEDELAELPFKVGNQGLLPNMSFLCARFTDSLGFASSVNNVDGLGNLNCAEILYNILTDTITGIGMDPDLINIDSFSDVGILLRNELQGSALLISAHTPAKTVIQEVLKQIDGVLRQDPATGKIELKLIRDDRSITNELDESNVVEVVDFVKTSWSDTYNQVRVTYYDRDKDFNKMIALAQDMANINSSGGTIRSIEIDYPGVTNATLAANIAARELGRLSVPIYRTTLKVNRTASNLAPGDTFLFSWDAYNLSSGVVMRVVRVDLGSITDSVVTIEAIQDRFASNVAFGEPTTTIWEPQETEPYDVSDIELFESPFYFINKNEDGAAQTAFSDSSYFWFFARDTGAVPPRLTRYVVKSGTDTALGDNLEDELDPEGVTFPGSARLAETILSSDGEAEGELSTVVIRDVRGNASLNSVTSDAEIRNGQNLAYCNGEIFGYTFYSPHGDGDVTLAGVRRALLDTTFQDWLIDDVVYFIEPDEGLSDRFVQWLSRPKRVSNFIGDTITSYYARFPSIASGGEQAYTTLSNTPFFKETPDSRYNSPMPPTYLEIDSSRTPPSPSPNTGPYSLDWAERNRTDASIRLFNDSSQTPESGTTYTVTVEVDGNFWWSASGVGAPTYSANPFPTGVFPAWSSPGDLIEFKVYSDFSTGERSRVYTSASFERA